MRLTMSSTLPNKKDGSAGGLWRGANAAAAAIALDPEDIERAQAQAERRGLEYQA